MSEFKKGESVMWETSKGRPEASREATDHADED